MSTTQYQVLVRNGSSDLFVASVLGMSDASGKDTREKRRLPERRLRSKKGWLAERSSPSMSKVTTWCRRPTCGVSRLCVFMTILPSMNLLLRSNLKGAIWIRKNQHRDSLCP